MNYRKLKETNLEGVKEVSKYLLYTEIVPDEQFPFICHHPFFNAPFTVYNDEIVNLLEEEEKRIEILKEMEADLNKMPNVFAIMARINAKYYMAFTKMVKPYLCRKDFCEVLKTAWTGEENPNNDPNVSTTLAWSWFKKYGYDMMDSEERAYYDALPDELDIYRGVASGRNPNGLSWTDSKEKAEWFRDRFKRSGNGKLLKCRVKKTDIACFLNCRNERELVFSPKLYMDKIKEI